MEAYAWSKVNTSQIGGGFMQKERLEGRVMAHGSFTPQEISDFKQVLNECPQMISVVVLT